MPKTQKSAHDIKIEMKRGKEEAKAFISPT